MVLRRAASRFVGAALVDREPGEEQDQVVAVGRAERLEQQPELLVGADVAEAEKDEGARRDPELGSDRIAASTRGVDAEVRPVWDDRELGARTRQLGAHSLGGHPVMGDQDLRRARQDAHTPTVKARILAFVRTNLMNGPHDSVAEQPRHYEPRGEERETGPREQRAEARRAFSMRVVRLGPVEVKDPDRVLRRPKPVELEAAVLCKTEAALGKMRVQEPLVRILPYHRGK